jgi:hypothetical protein
MAKSRKKPESSAPPQVGDKVLRGGGSEAVYTITRVYEGGEEVNLQFQDTNLQHYRVRTDSLTFVERKTPARTSNPFTSAESLFDAAEVLKRITAVQEENSQRFADDVATLKKYLKTQKVPNGVMSVLDGLATVQEQAWHDAVEEIEGLLEE